MAHKAVTSRRVVTPFFTLGPDIESERSFLSRKKETKELNSEIVVIVKKKNRFYQAEYKQNGFN